jgi:hypothetical protein
VLDTRSPSDLAAGHLRHALNVGLQGRFAEYTGDVIRPEQSIVLVCDPGTELEAKASATPASWYAASFRAPFTSHSRDSRHDWASSTQAFQQWSTAQAATGHRSRRVSLWHTAFGMSPIYSAGTRHGQ